MEFEWNEGKRQKNLAKHGLDFADVPFLDWETATVIEDRRRDYGEPRYWTFATWRGRIHFVAFTVRSTKIRIISFRRANRKEVRNHGNA